MAKFIALYIGSSMEAEKRASPMTVGKQSEGMPSKLARCGLFVALAVALSAGSPQVTRQGWFPGSSSISEQEAIPPAFRGTWASSTAECRNEDGVERVSIYANGVDFYESGGRLQRVTQAGQERSIRVRISYEGEGTFWDRIETWTLNQGGDRLTIAEAQEGGGDTNAVMWVRCG